MQILLRFIKQIDFIIFSLLFFIQNTFIRLTSINLAHLFVFIISCQLFFYYQRGMKKEDVTTYKKCFICKTQQINRLSLNQESIKKDQYLFCDNCGKKDVAYRKNTETYAIESSLYPLSLFSMNSHLKNDFSQFHQISQMVQQLINSTVNKLEKIIKHETIIFHTLENTFSNQTAENMQKQLKQPLIDQNKQDILLKIQQLKWLKQNEENINDNFKLQQRLKIMKQKFQSNLNNCNNKIDKCLQQLRSFINFNSLFEVDAQIYNKSKRSINSRSSKEDNRKRNNNFNKKKNQIPSRQYNSESQERELEFKSDINQIGKIFPLSVNIKNETTQIQYQKMAAQEHKQNEEFAEKTQQKKKLLQPQQKKARRRPKPTHLQPVPKPMALKLLQQKCFFDRQQILTINLTTLPIILYRQRVKNEQISKALKFQHQQNHLYEKQHISSKIDQKDLFRLKVKNIRYLEVQWLPQHGQACFQVYIQSNYQRLVYSISMIYNLIQQMANLEQIHVFTSAFFKNQAFILQHIYQNPNLKVIALNCANPMNKLVQQIGGVSQNNLQIVQIQGEMSIYSGMQMSDLKKYYPQSNKNKKIYNQYFVVNSQKIARLQVEKIEQQQMHDQNLPKPIILNAHQCWYIAPNQTQISACSKTIYPPPQQMINLLLFYPNIRNLWILYLRPNQFQNIKGCKNLDRVEHLTLGFYSREQQVVPPEFFTGNYAITKSINHLRSLNLINLNIYDMLLNSFVKNKCINLTSLKIQNCSNLKKFFYDNLPTNCPNLVELYVNELSYQFNDDYLSKFEKLETLILPWSLKRTIQTEQKTPTQTNNNKIPMQQFDCNINSEQSHKKSRLKYLNLYGSKLSLYFFPLINTQTLLHLNIGKCYSLTTTQLKQNLIEFQNLKSLCLDYLVLDNQELFFIIYHLKLLQRLSIAFCQKLDFSIGKLGDQQVEMLDKMTHLDLRHHQNHISSQYTIRFRKSKHLCISRPLIVDDDQLLILSKRQINVFSKIDKNSQFQSAQLK